MKIGIQIFSIEYIDSFKNIDTILKISISILHIEYRRRYAHHYQASLCDTPVSDLKVQHRYVKLPPSPPSISRSQFHGWHYFLCFVSNWNQEKEVKLNEREKAKKKKKSVWSAIRTCIILLYYWIFYVKGENVCGCKSTKDLQTHFAGLFISACCCCCVFFSLRRSSRRLYFISIRQKLYVMQSLLSTWSFLSLFHFILFFFAFLLHHHWG